MLLETVKKTLDGDPRLKNCRIEVSEQENQVIRLEGEADSWQHVVDAGHAAAAVPGVFNVVNDMTVPGLSIARPDRSADIAAAREKGVVAKADVVIIGAGISGCGIARELSKYPLSCIVVERGSDVADGATKANNGDIHPGHKAKPGTLKASDESGETGRADVVYCPETEAEVQALLQDKTLPQPVTVQGGKTGLWGGAVPREGAVMQLSQMRGLLELGEDEEGYWIRVQPGMPLEDLSAALTQKMAPEGSEADFSPLSGPEAYWIPALPLESSASLGGAVACRAAAMSCLGYGSLADAVLETRAVDREGRLQITAGLPEEGSILTEVKLRICPKPEVMWAVAFFCQSDEVAFSLCRCVSEQAGESVKLAACEWIGEEMLAKMREYGSQLPQLAQFPAFPEDARCMLYLELHGSDRMAVQQVLMQALGLFMQSGGKEQDTWAEWNSTQITRLRKLCHAAMEIENLIFTRMAQPELPARRIRMDVQASPEQLPELTAQARARAGQAACGLTLFGHLADHHIHIAWYPQTAEQYEETDQYMRQWLAEAAEKGAKPSIFYGTGPHKQIYWQAMSGR